MIVKTALGEIEGSEHGGYERYLGIRYAQPPVGPLRFRAPVPVDPWEGELDATAFGASAIQPPPVEGVAFGVPRDRTSEDCLFLNVYTPKADDGMRPVMVWIHGGAYTLGSADIYDGSSFATHGDVVVVTLNYRLGALGFLPLDHLDADYAGAGNNGIRDQICALEWVRDHIHHFGGDPGNVTVFGESAGGGSVFAVLASPSADGLYRRAIVQSGAPGFREPVGAEKVTDSILSALGDAAGGIDALVAAPAERLLEAQMQVDVFGKMGTDDEHSLDGGGMGYHPVVDGVVVTRTPAEAAADKAREGVPLLVGTNVDEGTLFALLLPRGLADDQLKTAIRRAAPDPDAVLAAHRAAATGREPVVDLFTEGAFRIPSLRAVDAHVAAGGTAYVYRFAWKTPVFGGLLAATHALEIPFVFRATKAPAWQFLVGEEPPEGLDDAMQLSWIGFARDGNPHHAGIPEWTPYDTDRRPTLVFDVEPAMVDDPGGEIRRAWYAES